ncbi:hypothetical protein F444_08386, partial [Phytophthora nicotianae P1976]
MRTTFTVAQDRKLVQLAVVYERRGTRISWSDVRRRMRTNQHTTTELRMRLHALKRTHGPVLADFPACFFSTGRIVNTATPRGDTSGARAQATAPPSGAVPGSGGTVPCSGSSAASAASEVRAQATASSSGAVPGPSGAVPGPSGAVPCSGGSAASTTSGAVPRADATGAHLEKTSSSAP